MSFGLILTIFVFLSPATAADPVPQPLRIRVLTYNIHHGEGMDGKLDLPRIAEVILATKADIVALQEVDVKTTRTQGVDQAAELGRLTKMHHTFGKAINFAGGAYGQAILSRWKIEKTQTHLLPSEGGREQRAALETSIHLHETGPVFRFITTHLDHSSAPNDRMAQCKKLNELFATDDAPPTVLVGDLNARPSDDAVKHLRGKWESAAAAPGMKGQPTFPSDKPTVEIDHILFRPAKQWRVVEVKVIEEKVASDHRPLLAVMEFVEAK